MREKPRDKARLQHILQAIDNINKFKEGVDYNEFESNKILFYAIVKNVEMVTKWTHAYKFFSDNTNK